MIKFQLISDIHLELKETNFTLRKAEDADALILAGDIGDPKSKEYKDLVHIASNLFSSVFIIKGNHEAYGMTIEETDDTILDTCAKYNNVVYLNRTSVDINRNLRVIGTTLWSNISSYNTYAVTTGINDFKMIKAWSIEKHNHEHWKDVQFIKKEIESAKRDNVKLIVVTHHAPSRTNTSSPRHRGCPLTSAFATDLSTLFGEPIIAWCYGHTHFSNDQIIYGTRLISNQKGYNNEDTKFNPTFTFDVISE